MTSPGKRFNRSFFFPSAGTLFHALRHMCQHNEGKKEMNEALLDPRACLVLLFFNQLMAI